MQIITELQSYIPTIHAIYDDMVITLGIFKPMLTIKEFGTYHPVENPEYCKAAVYLPPANIYFSLYDSYVTSITDGVICNIGEFNANEAFLHSATYTLLHELSHSQQNTFIAKELTAAMEYANEKNTRENFIPRVAPMLLQKYGIDFNRYSPAPYRKKYAFTFDHQSAVVTMLKAIMACCDNVSHEPNALDAFCKNIDQCRDITIIWSAYNQFNAPPVHTFAQIRKGGADDLVAIDSTRSMMGTIHPYATFDVQYEFGGGGSSITINVISKLKAFCPLNDDTY